MLTETSEKDAFVPSNCNVADEDFHTSRTQIGESKRTQGDGVVGIRALSADAVDWKTRCRR